MMAIYNVKNGSFCLFALTCLQHQGVWAGEDPAERNKIAALTQVWSDKGFSKSDSAKIARASVIPNINIGHITEDNLIDSNEARLLDRVLALKEKIDEYELIASNHRKNIDSLKTQIINEEIDANTALEKINTIKGDVLDVVKKRDAEQEKMEMSIKQINGTI